MDYVHVEVSKILQETDKAFLLVMTKLNDVELDDWDVWVPRSVIADHEDYDKDDTDVTMSIMEKFAHREGWFTDLEDTDEEDDEEEEEEEEDEEEKENPKSSRKGETKVTKKIGLK